MRAAVYTAAWVLPVTAPPLQRGAVLVAEHGHIAREHVGLGARLYDARRQLADA
jgi:hypothetical protein